MSNNGASLPLFMIGSSLILWLSALGLSHLFHGYPKTALGHRSHGVLGYDAVLGCFPPHFGYLFHLAYSLLFSRTFLYLIPEETIHEVGIELIMLSPIMFYTVFYLTVISQRAKDVSKPGGARKNPIARYPLWDNNNITIKDIQENKLQWTCAVAEVSHDLTESNFKSKALKMSGEPYGRQMWTTDDNPQVKQHQGKMVDEKLVLELAAGGQEADGYGFNPSKNPNR